MKLVNDRAGGVRQGSQCCHKAAAIGYGRLIQPVDDALSPLPHVAVQALASAGFGRLLRG